MRRMQRVSPSLVGSRISQIVLQLKYCNTRAVYIIGPDKKLKLSLLYPATTGRNFDEILRVVDSLQLTATRSVATPVDWEQGGSCMVVPGVRHVDTLGLFPKGVKVHAVPSGKEYLRTTPQPE